MEMLDRTGIFRAAMTDIGIMDTKTETQAVMVSVKFDVLECLDGDEWVDCRDDQLMCYGNFCLVKKDGNVNEFVVKQLQEALGWNGKTASLVDGWDATPCQITVQEDEYEGVVRHKVQWMRAYDAEPPTGLRKADANSAKSKLATYESKFRAICSTGKPKKPATKRPPPITKPKTNGKCTKEQAWEAFTAYRGKDDLPPKDLAEQWVRICGELFPGKTEDEYTPEDWGRIAAEGPAMIIPF